MSFFAKIAKEYDEADAKHAFVHSIAEQVAMLFSNRHDKYWAYDFKKNEICPIHEIFSIDYILPEFSRRLARAIEVFDRRVSNARVDVKRDVGSVKIMVNGNAKFEGKVLKLPTMVFTL